MRVETLESRRLLSISVDSGFGDAGRRVADLGGFDVAQAVVKQSDGKLIVAGNGVSADIFRLTSTGQPDNTFVYPADLAAKDVELLCVAIQPDGKIVAGGKIHYGGQYADYYPMIARFESNGALDKTFGTEGILKPFGDVYYGHVNNVRVMPGGKILFCGNNWPKGPGPSGEFAGQATSLGALDSNFGTGGLTTWNWGGSFDEVTDLEVLADGRIVLAGWGYFGNGSGGAITRLLVSGKKDTSLDNDGLKILSRPSGQWEEINALKLRSDGNLLIGGSNELYGSEESQSLMVGLINADGVFQSSFGSGGRRIVNVGGSFERVYDLTTDSAGRVYAGGAVRFELGNFVTNWDIALMRLTPSGGIDSSFNGGNVWTEHFAGDYDFCGSVLLASPTQLVIAGRAAGRAAENPSFSDAIVAAYKVDAPITPPANNASIAGTLFNDLDSDGVKDAGETALVGWKVFVDADKDGVLDASEKTATTDASGNYKFSSLAAGSYRVREVLSAGWRRTTPTSGYHDLTLAPSQNATAKNFGNTQKALISGNLFNDLDGDAIKDSGEGALSNWKVYLDTDKDGIWDGTEKYAMTDSSGNYSFKTLTAGSYRVRQVSPTGWRRTTPSSGYFDLTLASGGVSTGKNFGLTQKVLISGTVFNDLDGDRIKDATEVGLSSWRVYIDTDNDNIFDAGEVSVLTSSTGAWSFKSQAAGTYIVRVVQQAGWTRTTPTSGNFTITLASGGTSSGKLFGQKKI